MARSEEEKEEGCVGGGEERKGVTEGGREGRKDEWTEVGEREEKSVAMTGGESSLSEVDL